MTWKGLDQGHIAQPIRVFVYTAIFIEVDTLLAVILSITLNRSVNISIIIRDIVDTFFYYFEKIHPSS